jgi:type II secretory pathway predicted ATPase ExeA
MTSDGRSHTNPATADLLILPAHDRVRAIRSERWVSYPRVQKVTRILEQVLDHPRTTRMPSIAIFGDSGMGKTMLMQKFCADHPSGFDAESEQYKTRVLALQMTSRPGERRFYAQILDALGAPQNPGARIVDLERSALNLLRAAQIQILVIDEVHNILSGSYREQRTMLNTLRFISNDLKASLLCFGVMEAREAIQGDVQLARRFDVITLPRWSADEAFEELILAILRNQPMRERSVLTAQALRHILVASDGITARIFRMMNTLAISAIETGQEKITDEAVLNWKPLIDGEVAFA